MAKRSKAGWVSIIRDSNGKYLFGSSPRGIHARKRAIEQAEIAASRAAGKPVQVEIIHFIPTNDHKRLLKEFLEQYPGGVSEKALPVLVAIERVEYPEVAEVV